MKGCARSCALWLFGWAAAAYAFYLYFITLGDLGDGLYWASGGAGLSVVLACAYVIGIVNAARERSALLGSITGTPPADGKWVAVSGRIHSMHKLHGPLTGESVVAYKYAISRTEGSGKSRSDVKHFEGKALVPSTISTRQGSVRLLAVPTFDVPAADVAPEKAIERARAYIAATQFETNDTPKAQRAGTVDKEWTDDDGNFRFDKRTSASFDVPLDTCDFEEYHILQNEAVCAFGLYSSARGGLIPHANWAKQTRIMRGDAEAVAAQLSKRMVKYVFGILAFGAIAWGVVKLCQYNAV